MLLQRLTLRNEVSYDRTDAIRGASRSMNEFEGRSACARNADRREESEILLSTYRRTADPAVRERLIELHLPLVRALARRYAHCGERQEDLVQVGSIGLIEAIDRFDPERGSDLASFAIPTITGAIRNHLRDRTTAVKIPRRLTELNLSLRLRRESLAARLARPPTVRELARDAGVGEADVAEAIGTERVRTVVPLSTGDGDEPLDGAIVVDDIFESCDDRLLLAAGFRTLDERQRRILHLRFFAELSQAEIGRELGLSQVQVSRLIRASLERMRGALGHSHPNQPANDTLVRLQ
jgi:RNA polymerase sigma-B factor